MRGLWVVRTALVSPEAIDRVVDRAQAAGFNALFVQVRGRGEVAVIFMAAILAQRAAAAPATGNPDYRGRRLA